VIAKREERFVLRQRLVIARNSRAFSALRSCRHDKAKTIYTEAK
jgi:hypothetical protein